MSASALQRHQGGRDRVPDLIALLPPNCNRTPEFDLSNTKVEDAVM
jgi:hypothetical protein